MATVRAVHSYMHPVERVFDAWLTPAIASRFFFATRTGSVLQCEIEPEPGGRFIVNERRPHPDAEESFFDAEHIGNYVEIERPRRISFDFTVGNWGPPTRVQLDFINRGPSACEVVLEQDLGEEADAAMAARSRLGWERMLAQLAQVLGTRLRVG